MSKNKITKQGDKGDSVTAPERHVPSSHDMDRQAKQIYGFLITLAFYSQDIVKEIVRCFPVDGEAWRFANDTNVAAFASVVLNKMQKFEDVLNCEKLEFSDPGRHFLTAKNGDVLPVIFFLREFHGDEIKGVMPSLNVSSAVLVEGARLITCYDAIVRHYGWGGLICPPNNCDSCPWRWPDVPPISRELLAALLNASESVLKSFADKSADQHIAAILDDCRPQRNDAFVNRLAELGVPTDSEAGGGLPDLPLENIEPASAEKRYKWDDALAEYDKWLPAGNGNRFQDFIDWARTQPATNGGSGNLLQQIGTPNSAKRRSAFRDRKGRKKSH